MSANIPPLLTTSLSLIETLTSFLSIAFHSILYHRSLYPSSTFLLTRAYNFPVRQSRHPRVCTWINDTITHTKPLLVQAAVKHIVLVIINEEAKVMERFIFDMERFPIVGPKEAYLEFAARDGESGRAGKEHLQKGIERVDIDEQLRATLRKLDYACSRLSPLPPNCTFTVAVELRDGAEPPIGHPQPWVPSEPTLQTGERGESQTIGSDLGGAKSVPVRLVEAGEFILDTWIEEGSAKVSSDHQTQDGYA